MSTVLIVEDNSNQRKLYTQELEDDGYRVYAVDSGRAAVDFIEKGDVKPDIVVLDICMPDRDGVQTLSDILAKDRHLPVILNTAYTSYRENFLTWSAAEYVVKSADLTELKEAIKRILSEAGK
jgi:two-component system, response regulator, stage 0 sporulation protein F